MTGGGPESSAHNIKRTVLVQGHLTLVCSSSPWQQQEIRNQCTCHLQHRVRKEWSQELENKPKLSMLKKIAEYEEESSCANVKMKSEKRVLIKLRGGTAPFQMVTGRWYGLKREKSM